MTFLTLDGPCFHAFDLPLTTLTFAVPISQTTPVFLYIHLIPPLPSLSRYCSSISARIFLRCINRMCFS